MSWEPPEAAFRLASQQVQPEDQPNFKPIPANPGSLNFGTQPLQNVGEPARIPIGPADLLRTFGYGNVPSSDVSRGNVSPTNPIPAPVTEMPTAMGVSPRTPLQRVGYNVSDPTDPNASDIRNMPGYRSHVIPDPEDPEDPTQPVPVPTPQPQPTPQPTTTPTPQPTPKPQDQKAPQEGWQPPEAAFKPSTSSSGWEPPASAFAGGSWHRVRGTEFGEIDNPAHGGYTEPNWNKGAWGADISGWNTEGVALPDVPGGTRVAVTSHVTGLTTVTTVKDKGPGRSTGAGIDLLAGTRAKLGLPENSSYDVSYRILGPGQAGTTGAGTSQTGGWEPPAAAFAPVAQSSAPRAVPVAQSVDPKTIVKPAALVDLSPSSGAESYGASAFISGIGSDVQRAQPAGSEAQDYTASAGMSRGTTYDGSPPGTTRDLNLRDPNNPWQLTIDEIQNTPGLSDADKAWRIRSLRAQQAAANPGPNVQRALPTSQLADPNQLVAPSQLADRYRSEQWQTRPAESVEGGYAGTNLPAADIGTQPPAVVGQPSAKPSGNIFQRDLDRVLGGSTRQSDANLAQNLFATTGTSTGQSELAAAQRRLDDAKAGQLLQPYADRAEQERDDIALKDPEVPQVQKDAILAKRAQDKQAWITGLQKDVETATAKIKNSQAITPGPEYQKTIPGTVSRFIGDNVPFLAASLLGPFAPVAMATQMSESGYAQEYDKALVGARKAHSNWTEEQLQDVAHKAGTDAAQAGFENGLVVSFLHIPKLSGPITNMISRLGIRGTYMMLAGAAQDVADNFATKKYADPNQNIYDGIQQNLLRNFGSGVAFEFFPATHEALTERGLAKPGVSGVPAAEPALPRRAPLEPTGPTTPFEAQKPVEAKPGEPVTPPGEPVTPKPEPVTGKPEDTRPAVITPQPVEETEHWVSAIANRYAQERSTLGEIGEIAPGEGYSRTELRQVGLNMKPEEVAQHVSDLMHNTGDPKLQAAAITAEEARLSQRSAELSRIAESNPQNTRAQANSENAFKDLTDFHNGPVAKLKNNWHAQGMTLQGEVPVDLSTFNGLREAWLKDVGTPPSDQVLATMRSTAHRVRNAVDTENGSMNTLGRSIDAASVGKKMVSADEVRNSILERMGVDPCL